MDQAWIALLIAHSDLVVIAWSLLDQVDIRGATLACRTRCTRLDDRLRDSQVIPLLKIRARRSMSAALKAAQASTRFRVKRGWRSICDRRRRQSCGGWMRSSAAR